MDAIKELFEMDVKDILNVIILVLVTITFLYKLINTCLIQLFGVHIKWSKKEATENTITETKNRLDLLTKQHEENNKLSTSSDEEIKSDLKKVTDKINVISNMVIEMKKEKDHETLLQIKGQLLDIHDTCKERKSITSMQLEVFREKFTLYEDRGGNSFIHDIVAPFIESLPVKNE